MQDVIEFLRQLRLHNDRTWFEANKSWYRDAQSQFAAFVEELIAGIARFDSSVQGLAAKDCTYRIYRDTLFSADKTPYKTHMGAYVCRGRQKVGICGLLFPRRAAERRSGRPSAVGRNLYAGPGRARSIREEILDNGAAFEASVKRARGFRLYQGNKLKKFPAGFTAEGTYSDYLKLKDFYLEKFVDEDYMLQPDLARKAAADFKKTSTSTND